MEKHISQGQQVPFSRVRHTYGANPQNFGDLYYPETAGPHPVVILLHGGFWRAAYGLDLMTGLAEDLAVRGVAAWNVEYRRVGEPGGGWPNTLLDVAQASDYLRTIASRYQLDLQCVIPIGHSAGGHLAFWLAARHRLSATSPLHSETPLTLTASISLAGAVDLEHVWQLNLGRRAASDFLSGSPAEQPERYAHASPAALLPLGVPQILIHGSADDNVPLVVSQQYTQKAQQAGDQVKLITLPGADHFVLIDPRTHAWSATLQEVDQFL